MTGLVQAITTNLHAQELARAINRGIADNVSIFVDSRLAGTGIGLATKQQIIRHGSLILTFSRNHSGTLYLVSPVISENL